MNSKLDQLVETVNTYIEIIQNSFGGMGTVTWNYGAMTSMLEKFSELSDEVSIIETERQRLVEENAKLKSSGEGAWKEIAKLVEENRNLQKQVQDLKTWNDNQAKMFLRKEKRYFTDGSHDYAYTYQDLDTGMKYVEIHHRDEVEMDFDEDVGTDYALKA